MGDKSSTDEDGDGTKGEHGREREGEKKGR